MVSIISIPWWNIKRMFAVYEQNLNGSAQSDDDCIALLQRDQLAS